MGGGVEKRRILTLLSLTFIKDVVCIRRPPLLSFYDKLRHATIWWHPGNHRARHYLANPIPFDLCRWWTLFTIGRPPTSTPAPVKETGAKDGWGKRMTERRRVKVRMRGPKGWTFTFHSYRHRVEQLRLRVWTIKTCGGLWSKLLRLSAPWPPPWLLFIKAWGEVSLVTKALFSEGGIHARAFKFQIPPSIPLRWFCCTWQCS